MTTDGGFDLDDVADGGSDDADDSSLGGYSRKTTTCSSTVATGSVASSSVASRAGVAAAAAAVAAAAGVAAVDSITGRYGSIETRYRIDPAVIGTGYQACAVRECADLATGTRYALKTVRKGSRGGRGGLSTDLRREVDLLREADHEHVLRLVDVCEDAGHLHIVTDLCRGGELYDRIVACRRSSSPGCVPERDASRILREVLSGVSYLHSRGIVHRDLKPENVMFATPDPDSPVKIIDLGLARRHHRDSFEPYMSTVAGSSHFLAPEVLRRRYDRACDAWAAGVTTYVSLCGYPPFDGANDYEVFAAVRRGRVRFQKRHWKGASGDARDFVRRLLRANPRKRMTAEEALDHPWVARPPRDGDAVAPEGGARGGASVLSRLRAATGRVRRASAGRKGLE